MCIIRYVSGLIGVCVIAGMLSAGLAVAGIDVYQFESSREEDRFRLLIDELRCPKCQNQNIAGSNAGIAKDIKDRVYKLMQKGHSNDEIVAYMTERYGDFITYRPPVRGSTFLLWFGPFVFGLVVVLVLLWRYTRRSDTLETAELSAEEKARVNKLVKQIDESSE